MLNRMEIEEAGPDPTKIALEVHRQIGKAINLANLANELDIVEIKFEWLENFEGALVTDKSKDKGSILVNKNASRERKRFTIAHELGHFLNFSHVESSHDGFWCDKVDISSGTTDLRKTNDKFAKQEVEANRFACELLMPRNQIMKRLEDYGALDDVYDLARTFEVSKEAMARRYVELHPIVMAVIFSKDGKMHYPVMGDGMPRLKIKKGDDLPHLGLPLFAQKERAGAEIDPSIWLQNSDQILLCEHFMQANGFAMTLLQVYE